MKQIQLSVNGQAYAFPVRTGVEASHQDDWHKTVETTLQRYLQVFPEEATRLQRLSGDLASDAAASRGLSSRGIFPGHITGSGIVVEAGRALLIRHPIIGRWLQPGGHLEGNELPDSAAEREAEEETGWRVAPVIDGQGTPMLLDIDIHAIPENSKKGEPAHWHYDFLYVFAPLEKVTTPELPVKWVDIADIDEPRLLGALAKLPKLHASLSA
ncbi:NUDIX domain-containing protein [Robbsia sp. KACC 23696]|uniref:NUDIX hydrolase n=1 Tax=Robbsia sp. KACC 23696 TaxID=3149231 RepID=UPI00325B7D38